MIETFSVTNLRNRKRTRVNDVNQPRDLGAEAKKNYRTTENVRLTNQVKNILCRFTKHFQLNLLLLE